MNQFLRKSHFCIKIQDATHTASGVHIGICAF